MLTNFPNGVSSFGVPVIGSGPVFTTGNVFFVDSGHSLAADTPSHGSVTRPFATIEYAIGRCAANNGDHIIAMPGHEELMPSGTNITVDVAGVTLIGIGSGSARPTFRVQSAASDIDITAANVTFHNVLIAHEIDAVDGSIHIQAADFSMLNCETRDVTGQAGTTLLTNTSADRTRILNHIHRGASDAGSNQWAAINGGDGIEIVPRFIDGHFANAIINNISTAMTNFRLYGSASNPAYMRNRNSSDVILTAQATTTGAVGPFINARLADDAANITEAFVGADMEFFQPINIVNADGQSSIELNITASADS